MPVKRDLWTTKFLWYAPPNWPCPTCSSGTLEPKRKPDGVVWEETAESKRDEEEYPDQWGPEWERGRFVGLFVCRSCGEIVSAVGQTVVSTSPQPEEPGDLETFYQVSALLPGPPLFAVPHQTPAVISDELGRAWSVFWVDPSSCANRIRSCLELVLTNQGIKQFTVNTNRKRQRLNLHARIEAYKKKNASLAEAMMAVKWLGNAGSHGAELLSQSDVFDGLDLLEHVLIEVYEKRTENLARLGRQIIRRKGKPTKT